MALYVMGDLHLSLGTDKPMEVFGPAWAHYVQRIEEGFSVVGEEDITVLCGDLSWGMSLEAALPDLQFIHALPGKKLLLKGNHDYWWGTVSKMKKFFAEHGLDRLDILHNNCFFYGDYALCGTRGWFFEESDNPKVMKREVLRLETSLKLAGEKPILCFLHYPPLYQGYCCPEIVAQLEKHCVKHCYYGHLHGNSHRLAKEGRQGSVEYSLVAADYLRFTPKKVLD